MLDTTLDLSSFDIQTTLQTETKESKPQHGSTMEQLLKQMDKIEEGEETRKVPVTTRQSFREATFAKMPSQQREKTKSNVVKFYNVIPDSPIKIESHSRNKSPQILSQQNSFSNILEQESPPPTKHVVVKISPLRSANFNLKLPQRTHSQIKIKPILTPVNNHEYAPKNPNIHLTLRAIDPLIVPSNFESFATINNRFQCHTTRESGAKSPFGDTPFKETENQQVENMKQIPLFSSEFAFKKRESLLAPLRLPNIPNKGSPSPSPVSEQKRGSPSFKSSLVFDHLEANHQVMSEGNIQSSSSIKSSPKAHSDASPQVRHIGRFGSLGYINSPQSPIQIAKNSPIILTSVNNDYFFKSVSETPNTLKSRIVAFQTRRESPTFSFKNTLTDTRTKQ